MPNQRSLRCVFEPTQLTGLTIVMRVTQKGIVDLLAWVFACNVEDSAYLDNWLRVLRSDKRAIFKHAADAQRACDFLVAASEAGQGERAA